MVLKEPFKSVKIILSSLHRNRLEALLLQVIGLDSLLTPAVCLLLCQDPLSFFFFF